MTTKSKPNARIIGAKVLVNLDVRQALMDQLYLKLPDASEITIEGVDWDETVDWLDNDLTQLPIAVDVAVTE